MRACKVHVEGWSGGAACGARTPRRSLLTYWQFKWLPADRQCGLCLLKHLELRLDTTFGRPTSATPEMLVIVESIIVTIERLDAAAQAMPHQQRGCFHPLTTNVDHAYLEPCWCGNVSWLDPSFGERMIAIALGVAADGFTFRHACNSCGIAFRTKRPRGTATTCAFCRGKINEAMANDELYSSAWARKIGPAELAP